MFVWGRAIPTVIGVRSTLLHTMVTTCRSDRRVSGDLRSGRFVTWFGRCDADGAFEEFAFVENGAGTDESHQMRALTARQRA